MDRNAIPDRVGTVVDAVGSETPSIPVREVWVYGDVALGLDSLDRFGVYVMKDILLRGNPDTAESFEQSHGVKGVDKSVRAGWTREYPGLLRANVNDYAAPEKCLVVHLLPGEEPVHPEVYSASFEDSITQRLKGAVEHEAYEQILNSRGVCLYTGGQRSSDAVSKLRNGELAFPTLSDALEMLGLEDDDAETAVETMRAYRVEQTGTSVRNDVV